MIECLWKTHFFYNGPSLQKRWNCCDQTSLLTGDAHKCGNCSKKFPNGKNLVAHLSSEHDMSKKNHDLVYGVSKSTLRTFQCKVVLNGDVTCPTTFNHTYHNIKSHLMDFHQMSLVDYFKEHVLNFRYFYWPHWKENAALVVNSKLATKARCAWMDSSILLDL